MASGEGGEEPLQPGSALRLCCAKARRERRVLHFPLDVLQKHCVKTYLKLTDYRSKSFPKEVRRPKKPESTHCAVTVANMKKWDYKVKEGDWSLITNHFHPVTGMGELAAALDREQPVQFVSVATSLAAAPGQ